MDRLGDRRGTPPQERGAARAAAFAAASLDDREDRFRSSLTAGNCDMEVVLLWLDDLDDILFSAALGWEEWRRRVLQIGLAASLALAGAELSSTATQWAAALSFIAAASVGAWFLGTGLRILYYRRASGLAAA